MILWIKNIASILDLHWLKRDLFSRLPSVVYNKKKKQPYKLPWCTRNNIFFIHNLKKNHQGQLKSCSEVREVNILKQHDHLLEITFYSYYLFINIRHENKDKHQQ